MDTVIITSEKEAKHVWELLSPHKTIDDEWNFRYSFFKHLPYELRFITSYKNSKPFSLLPLQVNSGDGLLPPYAKTRKPFLEFFGGDDTDDNKILGEEINPQDLSAYFNFPVYLAPLDPHIKTFKTTEPYEKKYYLNLQNYSNYKDFLKDRWSKDSRKKLMQQIRRIYKNHSIQVLENNYEDIDLLADLNIKRFGKDSSFSFPYRKEIFRDLTNFYNVVMLTLIVDGEKEAVSYGINYKNIYTGMNAGVNGNIPDLPKLLIMLQINKAIELGCKVYDAGKGDSGWKEAFKLDSIPQFRLDIVN